MSAWVAAGARRRGAAGRGAAASDCRQALAAKALCHFRVAGVALCSVSSAAAAATCDKMLYFQRQSRQPVTFKMPAFGRHLMCGAPPLQDVAGGAAATALPPVWQPRPRQQGRLYSTASGGHPSSSGTAALGEQMLCRETQLRSAAGIVVWDGLLADGEGRAAVSQREQDRPATRLLGQDYCSTEVPAGILQSCAADCV